MAEEQKNAATAVENLPEAPLEEGQDNFAILEEAARSYLPPEDVERVKEAYRFALSHHRGQKRKSGEPYINHPVEVAIILAQNLHSDADTLCAGLLHDTVEDTDATFEQIERLFGKQVAELVDGVTKLTNISVSSLSEQQALNLRKMFLAMAKDIRVIIIKLADRLHNMRTLMAIPEDRRIFKAHETMEIYAPLANRLASARSSGSSRTFRSSTWNLPSTVRSCAWWQSPATSASATSKRSSASCAPSSTGRGSRTTASWAVPSTSTPSI